MNCSISSCPPAEKLEWQKSPDGERFSSIDIRQSKYDGSSDNPYFPFLRISNTTFDDEQYYRVLVWNKIGMEQSNTIFLEGTYKLLQIFKHF